MNGAEKIAFQVGKDILIHTYNKRIKILLKVVHRIANYRFKDMSSYELLCYENLIRSKRMLRRLHEKDKAHQKDYQNARLHHQRKETASGRYFHSA